MTTKDSSQDAAAAVPTVPPAVKAAIVIVGLLTFIYAYPRFLISALGKESPWTNYLYMYGFGTAFFLLGIYLILKMKSCIPGRGHDSKWLFALIGGLIFFICLHGFWVYMAISVPFKGA